MTILEAKVEDLPAIADIRFAEDDMVLTLGDGRKLSVPIEWYPRLAHGTREERANWRLFAHGHAIEWPDLDEHLHIEGLLAGRRSSESQQSIERWLASRAASRQE